MTRRSWPPALPSSPRCACGDRKRACDPVSPYAFTDPCHSPPGKVVLSVKRADPHSTTGALNLQAAARGELPVYLRLACRPCPFFADAMMRIPFGSSSRPRQATRRRSHGGSSSSKRACAAPAAWPRRRRHAASATRITTALETTASSHHVCAGEACALFMCRASTGVCLCLRARARARGVRQLQL